MQNDGVGGDVRRIYTYLEVPKATRERVCSGGLGMWFWAGGDVLSHPVARAVPSALRGLTAVFGMGTGVSPAPWPPASSPRCEARGLWTRCSETSERWRRASALVVERSVSRGHTTLSRGEGGEPSHTGD